MTRIDLTTFFRQLATAFEKPPLNDQTVQEIYAEVSGVPSESLGWIKSWIKRESAYWPRNLTNAILRGWDAWQAEHPERMRSESSLHGDCPYCLDGWIYMLKPAKARPGDISNRWIIAVARCAHCQHLSHAGQTSMTVQQINRAGYIHLPDGRPSAEHYAFLGGPTPRQDNQQDDGMTIDMDRTGRVRNVRRDGELERYRGAVARGGGL
jgi:hypothetical protein